MKKDGTRRFVLISRAKLRDAMDAILSCGENGDGVDKNMEVVLRPVKKDKTLKQLGALFGLWIQEEAERVGESEHKVHKEWKARFLARIYFTKPTGIEQENWVELCAIAQQSGDREKLKKLANRISLSWASLEQMKQYMAAIEQHYIAEGRPLTVPDPRYKEILRS